MSQEVESSVKPAQSSYVKIWEGSLFGQRQGQPVFITKLEGYRKSSDSQILAANLPPVMQIVRLLSQDHMKQKQYVQKADFLVFRSMGPHVFLDLLREKELYAAIQLPSQTLILSVSDKACRLIGLLFSGDLAAFEPSSQEQQLMQQHQQMLSYFQPQQQLLPHLQLQQQLQQQQLAQLQQQLSQLQLTLLQQQQLTQLQQQQLAQLQQQLAQLQLTQHQHTQLQQQLLPQQQFQQLPQHQQMVGEGMGQKTYV
ncbi:mediator of RNA polymerase II transcription subunit 25-like [Lotus japonicus]|uniref:mediator of RNA polymerase II transcription subunit 25-like n=1 Tax=Lotus japonicus TaxID=34305 RepID=UPI002584708E|nr:mediator of RNA polymerase II transcription subunit 25-like [Lotus japonicus]